MTSRPSRLRLLLPLAVLAALLTGCAGVPTAGPVEQVSPNVRQTQDSGVRIDAEPPRPDATPERIVAGFLSAMASLQPGFDVAKLYLTDRARQRWDPGSGTTIIDASAEQLVATPSSELLDAPIVGQLTRAGRYQSVGGQFRHDFGLTKVKGQWRISSPPPGLVITTSTFGSYYVSMQRYFLTPDGSRVVPETLRVPAQDFTPGRAVRALLEGPSSWLAPAVTTAIPASTHLTIDPVTTDASGTAEVNFDQGVASLSDTQRTLLATQVAWTLKQFPSVEAVRFAVRGQPLAIPSLAPTGVMELSGYLQGEPVDDTGGTLVAVRDGKLGQVDPSSGAFTPVSGALAKVDVRHLSGLAAGSGGGVLVWTDGRTLWRGTSDKVTVLLRGTSLGRPQLMADGTLWCTAVAGGRPELVRIAPDGAVADVPLTSQPKGPVAAFAVAPDQTRVALVVGNTDSTTRTGLVSLTGGAHPRTQGWYETRLTALQSGSLSLVTDIAWTDASQLVVLAGETTSPRVGAYTVSDDAATITSLGPADNVEPMQLVVHPRPDAPAIMVLASGGQLQEIEDAWRWRTVGTGIGLATLSAS